LRGRDAAYSAMLYAFVGAAKLARGTNHPNATWSGQ